MDIVSLCKFQNMAFVPCERVFCFPCICRQIVSRNVRVEEVKWVRRFRIWVYVDVGVDVDADGRSYAAAAQQRRDHSINEGLPFIGQDYGGDGGDVI